MPFCPCIELQRETGEMRSGTNHSLNPLANLSRKTNEKCKASRAVLKATVDLTIAFFIWGPSLYQPSPIYLLFNCLRSRFFIFYLWTRLVILHQCTCILLHSCSCFHPALVPLSPSPPSISGELHKSSCHFDWFNEEGGVRPYALYSPIVLSSLVFIKALHP